MLLRIEYRVFLFSFHYRWKSNAFLRRYNEHLLNWEMVKLGLYRDIHTYGFCVQKNTFSNIFSEIEQKLTNLNQMY